jgi:hypothetical protein
LVDAPDIALNPIFAEQSYFTRKVTEGHAFTGISIKLFMILKALRQHKGEYIICSDADLVILQKDLLSSYLDSYKSDITCMRDTDSPNSVYNIGFMLIKSSDETIALFQKVYERIQKENGHDQTIFNEELASFTGTCAFFSLPEIVQSNMKVKDSTILFQCLVSEENGDMAMVEKLISISNFQDISYYKYLLTKPILVNLMYVIKATDPENYIAAWDFECVDEYLLPPANQSSHNA